MDNKGKLYSGRTGAVLVEGEAVMHMSSWSLSISQDLFDFAAFGSRFKEKIPTIMDWEASADGAADFEGSGGQKKLFDALYDGKDVELTLQLDEDTYFLGSAFVESFDVDHEAEGAGEVSISLSGNGGLVFKDGSEA